MTKNYKTAKIEYFYSHRGREGLLMLEVKPEAKKGGKKIYRLDQFKIVHWQKIP